MSNLIKSIASHAHSPCVVANYDWSEYFYFNIVSRCYVGVFLLSFVVLYSSSREGVLFPKYEFLVMGGYTEIICIRASPSWVLIVY